MNCYQHPEAAAIAYCRSCGRPLCAACQRLAEGTVFCPEHVPVAAGYGAAGQGTFDPSNPYTQAQTAATFNAGGVRTSPGLAFVLGWIPGVGAIYNGQYIKGLVHAVIFGLLVSLVDSSGGSAGQPFLGIMLAAFIFYMAFEAYHTAKKRQMGVPVAEWSSLAASNTQISSRTPVGPILLIALGVLFLLDTLHLIEFRDIARFWPVLLIIAGAAMLYSRVTGIAGTPPPSSPPGGLTPDNPSSRDTSGFMGAGREQ
jgi:TM2 domain-containing membrane protein YozV